MEGQGNLSLLFVFMNKEIKEKWVAALRSGEYKQGTGCLHDTNDSYCCLGVLCDLASKEKVGKWERSHKDTYKYKFVCDDHDYCDGILPEGVSDWAGLMTHNPSINGALLSNYNDGKIGLVHIEDRIFNFNEIAELIEKNL